MLRLAAPEEDQIKADEEFAKQIQKADRAAARKAESLAFRQSYLHPQETQTKLILNSFKKLTLSCLNTKLKI